MWAPVKQLSDLMPDFANLLKGSERFCYYFPVAGTSWRIHAQLVFFATFESTLGDILHLSFGLASALVVFAGDQFVCFVIISVRL